MLLGQELKFKNKLCNLKLGTFFSALPGHRPGYHRILLCALKGQKLYKALWFAYFLDKTPDAMKPPLYFFSKLSPDFLACFKILLYLWGNK